MIGFWEWVIIGFIMLLLYGPAWAKALYGRLIYLWRPTVAWFNQRWQRLAKPVREYLPDPLKYLTH